MIERLDQADVAHVAAAAQAIPWAEYPGGWPGQIELALIDAVFSIQARYGGPTTGVRRVLSNYREFQAPRSSLDDLRMLAEVDRDLLASALDNRQQSSGRLKCDLVIDAAEALVDVGVVRGEDFCVRDMIHRRAYCRVHGLGPITCDYVGMNLGQQGVKADIHIQRFVLEAVGRSVNEVEAAQLLKAAAHRLNIGEIQLDYAVWSHMSGKARRRI